MNADQIYESLTDALFSKQTVRLDLVDGEIIDLSPAMMTNTKVKGLNEYGLPTELYLDQIASVSKVTEEPEDPALTALQELL